MTYGTRTALKQFNEWYTEGYMSRNTTLNVDFLYEIDGCEAILKDEIPGDIDRIFCRLPNDGPLGKTAFGKTGLGRGTGLVDETDLPKLRAINQPINLDFHEMSVRYSTDTEDYEWEILAFGPAVKKSMSDNVNIKI
jgi:hypothetical protein